MTVNIRQLSTAVVAGGRLTIGSDPAVDPATTGTTLYYRPYTSNQISLYTGSSWYTQLLPGSDISITTGGLSANMNYDVFIYMNAGAPTLELVAWAGTTTRATALTRQDGVLVKNGTTTKRYIGTIRTNNSTQFEDSLTKRFVWNNSNRIARSFYRVDPTASWTWTTYNWRQANNSASNQVEWVVGLQEDLIHVHLQLNARGAAVVAAFGIGIDSTTAMTNCGMISSSSGEANAANGVDWRSNPGIGYHYAAWLERGEGAGTTYYGTVAGAPGDTLSGLRGSIWS